MLKRINSCKGQATVEYVIVMAFFVLIALVLMSLLYAYSEYNWRLINTVSIPLP
jgi:hypothetical protein